MYSPITRAAGIVACTSGGNGNNRENEASSSGVGRPRTVYVGKYQYPVSLVQLAQVSDVARKKKAGFDLLMPTVRSLLGSHNVSDLINPVDGEIPIYTYSDLQNSEK